MIRPRRPALLRRRPGAEGGTEPALDPSSWSGALIVMAVFVAVLWIVEFVNVGEDNGLNRFGLKPRRLDGLWGVLTEPFLHSGYGHLLSNTLPVLTIGWVVMLSGLRTWLTVTAMVIAAGGLLTWLAAPGNQVIVGASGLVFGWLGYLLARAWFARTFTWIVVALLVLVFFGSLLSSLLPSLDSKVSWQAHLAGFVAGVVTGGVLHPRGGGTRSFRRTAVS